MLLAFLVERMEDKTMMKFTMNAKELKTMMEKGMAAIDKKASLSSHEVIFSSGRKWNGKSMGD